MKMKMTITMTMRTAIAVKAFVMKYRGLILAVTECFYLLVKLMLQSYETGMNGFLRKVYQSRTNVDGGLLDLKGVHYSLCRIKLHLM